MGGKHKQSQRTKNNVRPSSSGRSAEFLGSTIPHFVGFSAAKETGLVLPGFSLNPDDLDPSLNSNFQLVLKKMNKKDSTTKLKALQEFTELTTSSEPEAIKAVLPFWPRLYCVLAIDTDHRVREAAHLAHQQVVLKVKKNIAPYLKQIIGPWFAGQYDTYPPAATAATRSLQDAFPPNKIQEAIVFCQEEILQYICENLTVHTAQTLSNVKTTSTEDAEAKYQRVLISSMLGYVLYLNKVPLEKIEAASELNLKIISNSKFWKISKHKVAPIRGAWFNVVTALCQKTPFLLRNETQHVVSSVFGNLDENEPTVLPAVWEAALSVFLMIDDWWKYINVEKVMLPKLWKFLKEGGQGNASTVYPNLLPLLSHLPPTITDISTVYCSFFENLRTGLKHKNVLGSRSESTAVATSFVECLRYTIMTNQSDVALCEKLIKTQLFPILEWSSNESQACYKIVFNQVSGLIQYWSRNQNSTDNSNYSKYLDYFWDNLQSLFEGLLLNLEHNYDSNVLAQIIGRQIEFLFSLKRTFKVKKHLKVNFKNDGDETKESENDDRNINADIVEKSYVNSLEQLVFKTSKNYVAFINEKKSKDLIGYLAILMQGFENPKFLPNFVKQFAGDENENLMFIYNELLKGWLHSEEFCCKSVVDLVFLLFKYLNSEDRNIILNDFVKLQKEECLGWCLTQTLSYPLNADVIIQQWIRNQSVTEFLVKIAQKILMDECPAELELILKQAFSEKPDEELFISEEGVSQVVNILKEALLKPSEYTLTADTCASFTSYISEILYTEKTKLKYGDDLLLALFSFSTNSDIDPDSVTTETIWEVNTAWQDALSVLCRELSLEEFKNLQLKFADIIEGQFMSEALVFNVHPLVEVIVNILLCIKKNAPMKLNDVLQWIFARNFLPTWKNGIEYLCKQAEYLTGKLSCPYESFMENNHTVKEEDIVKYFMWLDLFGQVLVQPVLLNFENDNDDDDEEKECLIKTIAKSNESQCILLELLYSITLGCSFTDSYTCTKYHNDIHTKATSIKTSLSRLFQTCPEHKEELESILLGKIANERWLWIKTLYIFYTEFDPRDLTKTYLNLLSDVGKIESMEMLQLTQIFSKHLTYADIQSGLTPVESFVALRSLLSSEDIEVPIAEAFGKIEALQLKNRALFLYESAVVKTITWEETETIIEIIRLYSKLIELKSDVIEEKRWDLIIIPLSLWTSNIVKSKIKYQNIQIAAFIGALADLLVTFDNYLRVSEKKTIMDEWRDVFAQDIHKDVIELWIYLLGEYKLQERNISMIHLPFLQKFGKVLSHLDYVFIFIKRPENMPKWSTLLHLSCDTLTHPVYFIQLCSYHMLTALLPGLVEVDSASVNMSKPHEKGLVIEQFKEVLLHTQEIVHHMLLDFRLGEDSCRVELFTDSYTYTFAYFLIWDILLSLCEQSSTELRYQYADWLRNHDFLTVLLGNIFKLMPLEILQNPDGKSKKFSELFSTKFSSSLSESCTSENVEHIVCWVYARALSQLPALVRQWWSDRDSRTAQIVEKVTSSYVSPLIYAQELNNVAQHEHNFKNMVIKVHPTVREIVAVYTVDEAQMELVITLPANYPLGSPDVQCNRQIGGTCHRQWLMQLKMCVLHQNGYIWDGLLLWNNNLDKKFDGVEECYICFAVLHQGTYQLPRLSCQTCKKKFHSACLYKWFSTSNKSTCPICRNLF